MSLKKLLCVMIASLVMSTAVYAVEISIGASVGAGLPFMYGDTFDETKKLAEADTDRLNQKFGPGYTLVMPQIDVMFAFLPYLALETGLGYKLSSYNITYNTAGSTNDFGGGNVFTNAASDTVESFNKSYIYIPIMLRGQYEYDLGVTYISAGVKLGFSVNSPYLTSLTTYTSDGTDERNGDFSFRGDGKPAPFLLDVSFALGQEFKVADSHYVGLRVNYDLGIIKPFQSIKDSSTTTDGQFNGNFLAEDSKWNQDDLTFALTYRYAFGK